MGVEEKGSCASAGMENSGSKNIPTQSSRREMETSEHCWICAPKRRTPAAAAKRVRISRRRRIGATEESAEARVETIIPVASKKVRMCSTRRGRRAVNSRFVSREKGKMAKKEQKRKKRSAQRQKREGGREDASAKAHESRDNVEEEGNVVELVDILDVSDALAVLTVVAFEVGTSTEDPREVIEAVEGAKVVEAVKVVKGFEVSSISSTNLPPLEWVKVDSPKGDGKTEEDSEDETEAIEAVETREVGVEVLDRS